MDIRTALARVKTVEEGLSITDPANISIRRVYTYFPHQSTQPEVPCFMHDFTLLSHSIVAGLRRRVYLVRVQFWAGDADLDRSADIAAAFEQKWLDAFANDVILNGLVTGPIKLRGGTPTLVATDWAKGSAIGLELAMEIPMNDAPTVGI